MSAGINEQITALVQKAANVVAPRRAKGSGAGIAAHGNYQGRDIKTPGKTLGNKTGYSPVNLFAVNQN